MASLALLPLLSLLLVCDITVLSQPNKSSVLFETLTAKCPEKLTGELKEKFLKFASMSSSEQSILENELSGVLIKCVVEPALKRNPLSTQKTPASTSTTSSPSTAEPATTSTAAVPTSTVAATTSTVAATTGTVAATTGTVAATTGTVAATTGTVDATTVTVDATTGAVDATTNTAAVTTTEKKPPTTDKAEPTAGPSASKSLCLTATNLTEYWRNDDKGSDIQVNNAHSKKGNACDFHKDLKWFRFAEAAGNRILNYAPDEKSCGTLTAYWSNGTHPSEDFKLTTVEAFGTQCLTCSPETVDLEVIKCGKDDFIYKLEPAQSEETCESAFCGMSTTP